MKINKDLCDICGTCLAVCKKACITIKEFEVIIDKSICNKCKNCLKICPPQAIEEE